VAANEDAPVRGRAEIDIEAPPQVVWEVVTRFENWPNWNPDVKSMSFPGPLAPGTEFRWKAGPGTIVSTLDRIEPPRYISWRGRTLTISAYHEWWLVHSTTPPRSCMKRAPRIGAATASTTAATSGERSQERSSLQAWPLTRILPT
jgi:uncharacterized protein YndB with AHSA1/START domain